jgi:hypothetical protein
MGFSLGIKRPGREADHSLPSSSQVKNAWSYTSTPQYVFMAWCLFKRRGNFAFTFVVVVVVVVVIIIIIIITLVSCKV